MKPKNNVAGFDIYHDWMAGGLIMEVKVRRNK